MLTIPITTKNVGNIPYNVAFTIDYDLLNNTDADILITGFGAGCGCSTPTLSINPIPANSSGKFSIVYNAGAKGSNNKSAWIKVDNKQTDFFFSANVI